MSAHTLSAVPQLQLPDTSPSLFTVGVDWITVTQKHGVFDQRLHEVCEPVIARERSRGNDIRPWQTYGYEGYRCGGIEVGTRADGEIARISGGLAASHWRSVFGIATGCSRIDVQLTYRVPLGARAEILRCYRQAKRHRPKVGQKPVITLLSGTDGACTVYIGKRSSDQMGRVYDKAAQSRSVEYKDCVRFEVEFKRKYASRLASWLNSCPEETMAVECEVLGFFRNRGIRSPCFHAGRELLFGAMGRFWPQSVADNHRRLAWLQKSVGPTVARLRDEGLLGDVLRSLGLDGRASGADN